MKKVDSFSNDDDFDDITDKKPSNNKINGKGK